MIILMIGTEPDIFNIREPKICIKSMIQFSFLCAATKHKKY